MANDNSTLDPSAAFAELGLINLAQHDLEQVLTRVSDVAKRAIPGADEVSVSLLSDGSATTAAFTGDLALHVDEQQYEKGYGPCLEAAQGGATVIVADMTTEDRWPAYVPRAVEHGVLSSMSVALPIQQAVTGALNVYARTPHAFDADAVELGETFAGYAAVAVANAHLYASAAALAKQMQTAMASRAVIEQAKGIVMGRAGCTADEAFDLLTRQSQHQNRKLRDVAQQVVEDARKQ